MEYRRLGASGLKVSALSYGSWISFGTSVGVPEAEALMKQCYDAGINFFDNSERYGKGKAEEIMGEAIQNLGWERSSFVISAKVFWGPGGGPNDVGLSRKHIIEGTKASIKRLRLEYVDLLLAHRPDYETPIEETVRAMNFVIDQGLALYWGTSEWTAEQIREACSVAQRLGLQGPVLEQPEYSLFARSKMEGEFLGLFNDYGLGAITWSPLASGLLTGKYGVNNVPEGSRFSQEDHSAKIAKETNLTEEKLAKVDALKPIAKSLDCTLPQLCLAWVLKNPNVSSVLLGGTKHEQIAENLKALAVVPKLTDEVMQQIDEVMQNKPAPPVDYKTW